MRYSGLKWDIYPVWTDQGHGSKGEKLVGVDGQEWMLCICQGTGLIHGLLPPPPEASNWLFIHTA